MSIHYEIAIDLCWKAASHQTFFGIIATKSTIDFFLSCFCIQLCVTFSKVIHKSYEAESGTQSVRTCSLLSYV